MKKIEIGFHNKIKSKISYSFKSSSEYDFNL